MKACRMYPRLFVSLVYTPQSGMWLMATPEILLKGEQGNMSTMSLAGTQKAEPSRTVADYPVEGVEWSHKKSGGATVCHGLYRRLHQGFC